MMILFLIFSLLLSSCSFNPLLSRRVTVTREDRHPWEEEWGQNLSCKLVLSGGEEILLADGERSVDLFVPHGRTIYVTAYPLGTLSPLGCAITADSPSAVLTSEEGRLVEYLNDLSGTYGTTLSQLDYKALLEKIEEKGVSLRDVDLSRLVSSLLNDEFSPSSISSLGSVSVTIEALPEGRWIADRSDDASFWFLGEAVRLSLKDGLHCFLCRERGLLLRVLVDAKRGEQYQSIRSFTF